MKAAIQDADSLASLDPLKVASYLRAYGWTSVKVDPERDIIWEKPSPEATPFEVQLPLDRGFRDYARRMAEVLQTLEVTEKRSQLDIFRDLHTVTSDVIRFRLLARDSHGGSVPIDQGVELVESARKLMEAGAGSADRPQAAYLSHLPKRVTDYVRSLRLGQTEIGSYVVTVLSEMPLQLKGVAEEKLALEDPFERKVTNRLAFALLRARRAAEQSILDGGMASFEAAVPHGVNANLCAALAGVVKEPNSHDGVKIEFAWSPLRPQLTAGVPSAVLIPPPLFDVFEEAGRHLRNKSEPKFATVIGRVVKLETFGPDDEDMATLLGEVFEKLLLVRFKVPPRFRLAVITSFQDRVDLRISGEVTKSSKGRFMSAPESIALDVPVR